MHCDPQQGHYLYNNIIKSLLSVVQIMPLGLKIAPPQMSKFKALFHHKKCLHGKVTLSFNPIKYTLHMQQKLHIKVIWSMYL